MKKNIPRLYQPVDLEVGATVTLSPTVHQHVIKSLRLRENAEIIIFNGKGGEYLAHITTVDRAHAAVCIDSFDAVSRESSLSIHLGQCVSRAERMDYAIQKSVEVGVSEITPILSARCQFKLPSERMPKRMQHWQRIIISACEQSGRTYVPVLNLPITVSEWAASVSGFKLVCDGAATSQLADMRSTAPINLLIGPEGGLAPEELATCYKHGFGGFSLGKRTLRTETAPIVAITLLHSLADRI